MTSVLVVGATGSVGSKVVEGLLDRGVPVRATTRDPGRARIPAPAQVFRADLTDPASFQPALDGAQAAFLYADTDSPEALIAQFAAAGMQRVVLLSSWAAAKDDAEHNFNGARFWRAERALEASGMEWTFVRPGTFASNAARWQWNVRESRTVPLPYPDSLTAPVHEDDIADIAVRALTSDDLVGQGPLLTGPTVMTVADQVHQIGDAIGERVEVAAQTDAEARASLSRFMAPQWADYIVDAWKEAVGNPPDVSTDYERIMGRPARDFAQWARDHADLFR